jgi:hypothetical protein
MGMRQAIGEYLFTGFIIIVGLPVWLWLIAPYIYFEIRFNDSDGFTLINDVLSKWDWVCWPVFIWNWRKRLAKLKTERLAQTQRDAEARRTTPIAGLRTWGIDGVIVQDSAVVHDWTYLWRGKLTVEPKTSWEQNIDKYYEIKD